METGVTVTSDEWKQAEEMAYPVDHGPPPNPFQFRISQLKPFPAMKVLDHPTSSGGTSGVTNLKLKIFIQHYQSVKNLF